MVSTGRTSGSLCAVGARIRFGRDRLKIELRRVPGRSAMRSAARNPALLVIVGSMSLSRQPRDGNRAKSNRRHNRTATKTHGRRPVGRKE
ncbi:MAG: hypothetical protein DWQ34_14800 [Planctomycetota bacterium]|nr:MAG: hypothetical protein DWQ29_17275 [Planctomycetota bacterium]REJ91547.1 MAG: hypothetical protein DWQ34_14800 [Planctomycetota bacterium]REK20520.1 MAG: hypothetical protein DWQ41_24835 [Planctomycetota bacterium]REK28274.1 MAG: hypothetical protein DWQ45_24745 [Planctomycetota bacterium]